MILPHTFFAALAFVAVTAPLVGASALGLAEAEHLFVRRVLPILQEKCLSCHGQDEAKIKGGLDLTSFENMQFGGDSAVPAITLGKPEESPLYLAISRDHVEWEAMPPKDNDALTPEQVRYIHQWISASAPWPDGKRVDEIMAQDDQWSSEDGITVQTSGGLADVWTKRRYKLDDLWAYQPLKKIPPPSASSGAEANPIDAFINAELAAANLAPAPRAERSALIRRVTYNLTGLPPTIEEVDAFLRDPAPEKEAFAKVVERLLASPHYGEQMARHWLDVVRYADSSGFANDFVRGNAWRYRDYVVRAFNEDKPYDQFVREQVAGDEIAPDDPASIVATGFLRMGPWELTSMEVPRVARVKFLDDVTDSVGQTFLAHPLQCARCHDHKFDPVPTRDYYSMQAIFATTQMAERPAPFLPQENTAGFEERKYLEQRIAHYQEQLAALEERQLLAARVWFAENNVDPTPFEAKIAELAKAEGKGGRRVGFGAARAALLREGTPEGRLPGSDVGLSAAEQGLQTVATKGIQRLRWEIERYEAIAFATYVGLSPELNSVMSPLRLPKDPLAKGVLEKSHILTGGDPFAEGEPVTPGVISAATFLGGMDEQLAVIPSSVTGRRAALAQWIVSPTNPLTARTYANRVWLWHFGQAIAGNPNNFGATGKKPTHPELLDWLAHALVESGWSTKALHRLILSSDTYARASTHPQPAELAERDPNRTRYAVFNPRRLTAEEMRDSMLAVSGELNRAIGGIPARPEINPEAALQPRQVMGTVAEAWQPSATPAQRHRRSLYALKLRGQLDPFMEVFNAPSPDLSCEARDASTVTPQVFSLFNSEASLARAVAWAVRLQAETSDRGAAVERAFALAFGRKPSEAETEEALAHWEAMTARHQQVQVEKPVFPAEIQRETVHEATGETFTYNEPLEVSADFVPDLHLADVPAETRGLAELCLVLLNANEFAYIY